MISSGLLNPRAFFQRPVASLPMMKDIGMTFLVFDMLPQFVKGRIDVRLVAGEKLPAGPGFPLVGERGQDLRRVGPGINRDGDQHKSLPTRSAKCSWILEKLDNITGQLPLHVEKNELITTTLLFNRSAYNLRRSPR